MAKSHVEVGGERVGRGGKMLHSPVHKERKRYSGEVRVETKVRSVVMSQGADLCSTVNKARIYCGSTNTATCWLDRTPTHATYSVFFYFRT